MSGFVSLTATAPTLADLSWPSVIGAQWSPASVVFHRPPPPAPKYAFFGWPRTPLTAIERPPRWGPMLRHLYPASSTESGTNVCPNPLVAARGSWRLVVAGVGASVRPNTIERETAVRGRTIGAGWLG